MAIFLFKNIDKMQIFWLKCNFFIYWTTQMIKLTYYETAIIAPAFVSFYHIFCDEYKSSCTRKCTK